MFAAAGLVIVNKTDLLPYVPFDIEKCRAHLRSLNPGAEIVPMSAMTGEGSARWYGWLRCHASQANRVRPVDKT
jgi:hydrogenase nickel incorporation protein HypB